MLARLGSSAGASGKRHGRIGFEGVIEKQHLFPLEPAGDEGIPKFPNRLANDADGEEMIDNRHG